MKMQRLIEDRIERQIIEKVSKIYDNVDVIMDKNEELISISGNGNYIYDDQLGNVYWLTDDKKILLSGYNYMAEIVETSEDENDLNTPNYYDNTNGSLYKVAQQRGWNTYLFDIVKRLERAEKKGEFDKDLDKTINLIKLYRNENKI